METTLNREDFNFTYNHRGYMIQYKNQNIGGAGIHKNAKGSRGRAAASDREYYKEDAERTIQNLISGKGRQYIRENIEKIDIKEFKKGYRKEAESAIQLMSQ